MFCSSLLDCIGISFNWLSGPVTFFLYSIATIFIMFVLCICLVLISKIKSVCGLKHAAVMGLAVQGARASIIITEKLTMPLYNDIELVKIPVFEENILNIAEEIVEFDSDFFGLDTTKISLRHNCKNGILLPLLQTFNCYNLNRDTQHPLSTCHNYSNVNSIPIDMDFNVLNDNEKINLNMIWLTHPSNMNWTLHRELVNVTSEKWYCKKPRIIIKGKDSILSVSLEDIDSIIIKSSIEMKEDLSNCLTSDCIIGFKSLTDSYRELGIKINKFNDDKINIKKGKTRRTKRSANRVESKCETIGILALFGIWFQDCEIDLSDQNKKFEFLSDELKSGNIKIERLSEYLKESFGMIKGAEESLNSNFIKIESEMTQMVKLSDAKSLIMHLTNLNSLIMSQQMKLTSYITKIQSQSKTILKTLRDHMMLHIWTKRCTYLKDCNMLNNFLSSKIIYWEDLIQHNFNSRPHLSSDEEGIYLQFLAPKNVTWADKIIPIQPSIEIRKDCNLINDLYYLCSKCYKQDFNYLTANKGGSNQIYNTLDEGRIYIKKINYEENCLSSKGDTRPYLSFGDACFEISDDKISLTLPENCETKTKINVKAIMTELKIDPFKNVEFIQDLNFNDLLINKNKGIGDIIDLDTNLKLINRNSTILTDLINSSKGHISSTFNTSILFNLLNFVLILSTIIYISYDKGLFKEIYLLFNYFKTRFSNQNKNQALQTQIKDENAEIEELQELNVQNLEIKQPTAPLENVKLSFDHRIDDKTLMRKTFEVSPSQYTIQGNKIYIRDSNDLLNWKQFDNVLNISIGKL